MTATSGVVLVAGAGLALVEPGWPTGVRLAFGVAVTSLFSGLGLVVVRRQVGAVVGLLMTLLGLLAAVTQAKEVGWQVLAARPAAALRLNWLIAVLQESAWTVVACAVAVLLYFPDGRLPSRRWRAVPVALVATVAVAQVEGAFASTPFLAPLQGVPRPWAPLPWLLQGLMLLSFVTNLAMLLACASAPIVRWRRAGRRERQQLKWLAVAGIGIPAYPLLCLAEVVAFGRPVWFSAIVGLSGLVGVPLAVWLAMVRHDLYDVDRALAGAVTWVLVSGGLVGLYGVVSGVVGLAVGRESRGAVAAGVVLAGLALSPLRARVQRLVDRRLYPLRRAAFDAVDALLADVAAGRARPEALEDRLRPALRDPRLRVTFILPGAGETVDAEGVAVGEESEGPVPVLLGDQRIGELVPGPDSPTTPNLLAQVAARCAPVAEMVRLRLELAGALRDVEQSRARLVQAGFEERRRLERDLHDGAQQRLVSLGMALRLAQRHLGDGTVDVDSLLDTSVAELGTAVAELRQIAHGLRPTSLDDGLAAAVAAMLRTVPITVDLDICPDPLPDDVTTTAYYVVSEAVTNAVKHARATRISLQIRRVDGQLELRVSDDGEGGAVLPSSSSIPDRVAALRGTWRVDSRRGQGTTVEAAIPCAS